MTASPACVGGTITFTASGVADSGGTERVNCNEVPIAAVPPTYTWTLTIPPDYPPPLPPLSGAGASVNVEAKVPGTYATAFTANAARQCPPPGITLPTAMATAREANITAPSEGDIFLKGGEAEFRASPTAGATYQWSVIAGLASPTSATTQDFTTMLLSSGNITVKLVVTINGKSCESEKAIIAVVPEVVEISFLNDFSLKEWKTNDTGSLIVDPVWTKNLGGAVTKDRPAAYMRSVGVISSRVKAVPRLAATSDLTSMVKVVVRAAGTVKIFGQGQGLAVQVWPSDPFSELTSDPISGYNGAYAPLALAWEYLVMRLDGTWPSWDSGVQTNGTNHRIYCTFDTPQTLPLYDLALQKICLEYANGLATISAIAGAANTGIDGEICYDPSTNVGGHVLNIYSAGTCQCINNAELLELLAQSTGIAAQARYFYGGLIEGTAIYFHFDNSAPGALDGPLASLRTTAAGHDNAPPLSHFTFHVQTLINGVYYDPSYGSVGQATSLHQCAGVGATVLEMSQAVFGTSTISVCSWPDDHLADPAAPGCP